MNKIFIRKMGEVLGFSPSLHPSRAHSRRFSIFSFGQAYPTLQTPRKEAKKRIDDRNKMGEKWRGKGLKDGRTKCVYKEEKCRRRMDKGINKQKCDG